MPRLQPLNDEQAPADSKPIFQAIQKKFGMVPNIFRTLGHHPAVLEAVTKLNDAIHGDLPDKYRELAYLKSSRVNNCEYCSHYHTKAAQKAGVSDAQLEALPKYADSDQFDEKEKAVLNFAENLTKTTQVDAAVVEELKSFLSEPQLVQLAATVALANVTNRINHAFDIELP